MMSHVALCADMACLQHPETLGLAGENLAAQEWLRLFATAAEARRFLRDDRSVDEVWIASCDDVAPINLAATLKRDRVDRRVCLVAFEGTGSLKSRASAAGIDASLTRQAFLARYAQRKRSALDARCEHEARAREQALASLDGPSGTVMAPPAKEVPPRVWSAACAASEQEASGVCKRAGFLMPIVSGSGGAGKSTVSALSALLCQRLGYRTLLLDFDLQFGDMPDLLGVERPPTVDEVLSTPARIEHLAPEGDLPALLAAPRRLEQSEAVAGHASALLDWLLPRFDVVVCNTGASWAEQHAVLLERSSKALFLIDQRASSLRACRHALDLCARCGIATGPFSFAVNRCAKNALFTSIDVSCALRGAPVVELAEGGREVEELLGMGLPKELLSSRNALCGSLETLLRDMLPSAGASPSAAEPAPRRTGLGLRRGKRPRRRGREAACL